MRKILYIWSNNNIVKAIEKILILHTIKIIYIIEAKIIQQ
jgi:hypothetical protein